MSRKWFSPRAWGWSGKGATSAGDRSNLLGNRNFLPPIASAYSASRLARAYLRADRFDDAKRLLEESLVRFPGELNVLLQLTELNWQQKRYSDAAAFTSQMLERDSSFGAAHQCKAALALVKKDCDTAAAEAEKTLELGADSEYISSAHWVLAECATSKGDYKLAADHWAKNLEYPELRHIEWGHARYAVVLARAGRHKEANREAKRALTMAPKDERLAGLLRDSGLPLRCRVVSIGNEWNAFRQFVVSGVVLNETEERVSSVHVIAESLDENGIVVGTGHGYVNPSELAPGATGSFSIMVEGNPQNGKKCRARIVE